MKTLASGISIATVISFLAGIGVGFVLLLFVFLGLLVSSIKKKNKKNRKNLSLQFKKEVMWIVEDCKIEFNNSKVKEEIGLMNYFKAITIRMIRDIASKFNPASKMPHLELSLEEILLFTRYISKRVDEIFDTRVLKSFRKTTIKKIIDLRNLEKTIMQSSVVQGFKASGASKVLKIAKILNPVFWVKKLIYEPIVNKIINNILLDFLEIIGEEAYNIYSKKLFINKEEFDSVEEEYKQKIQDLDNIYKALSE